MIDTNLRDGLAEAVGTFALVLAGTGAIIFNDVSGGIIGHLGVALTFGLIVMTVIHAIGDRSGAHINPAVTIAFAVAGRFPWRRVPLYVVAQTVGGILASLLLLWYAPTHQTLGMTLPTVDPLQALVMEILLTLFLMFVILSTAHGAQERGITAALAIGGVVALEAIFAGPITGASMNPARSIAPAIAAGNFVHQWIYIVGPVLGAALAVPLAWGIFGRSMEGLAE
ncbi:MAG: MIP family channel protein [Ignavibacteriae bacterium]|nr:MIP family channel protein [Ignavibacteriota bacterium]MCB9215219.1 MIP family channel protein [Ignavibacteria bacterium]